MRIVFLGSPPFATPILARLIASERHDVVGLVTPPDRPRGRGRTTVRSELAAMADDAGIPVVQPTTTKDDAFIEALTAFGADALVVASYGEILRRNVLELCPHGALNVHGSLLPRWRGASPIQRAVAAGDAETGVAIQRMVLALDAGDVLLSRSLPIGPRDTSADLFGQLADLGAEATIEALDAIEAGEATYTPQDESLVTLAPKLTKADGLIDFNRTPAEIDRHVRAMTTWPGARTSLPDGRDLVVLEVEDGGDAPEGATPGTVVQAKDFLVATAGGRTVRLVRIKPAGKGAMDGAAFLRGVALEPGAALGKPALD